MDKDKFIKYALKNPDKLSKFEELKLMEFLSERSPNPNIKKELKKLEKLKDKLLKS